MWDFVSEEYEAILNKHPNKHEQMFNSSIVIEILNGILRRINRLLVMQYKLQ